MGPGHFTRLTLVPALQAFLSTWGTLRPWVWVGSQELASWGTDSAGCPRAPTKSRSGGRVCLSFLVEGSTCTASAGDKGAETLWTWTEGTGTAANERLGQWELNHPAASSRRGRCDRDRGNNTSAHRGWSGCWCGMSGHRMAGSSGSPSPRDLTDAALAGWAGGLLLYCF